MTEAPTKNGCGPRRTAGCWAVSVALCTITLGAISPARAQSRPAGAPIDPYGNAPASAPIDPYPPTPPPLLPAPLLPSVRSPAPLVPAPLLPPLNPPAPAYAAPIDPYAPAQRYAYPPPAPPLPPQLAPPPPPYTPGGCYVAGCPEALSYQPISPLVTELRPRYGVMAAGISILGGLWVISTASAVLSERGELAVPLAGPILTAIDLNHSYDRSASLSVVTGLLVMDALLQTTGLIMAIAGGASRVAVTRRAPQHAPRYPSVSPYGAGLSGRF